MDNFEVINHNDSTNMLQAISYINENLDAKILQKIKRNIGDVENMQAILVMKILNLMNAKNFSPLFRKSDKSHNLLTSIWVSEIRLKAQAVLLRQENRSPKKALSKKILQDIASLSYDEDSLKYIDNYLYEKHGIILVYAKNIEGMNTDAITFKLEDGTPVVGMSLKYSRYDYFWFTLMHELAHIYRHNDVIDKLHFDNFNEESENDSKKEIEIEADALAKSSLIPRRVWAKCRARTEYTPNIDMLNHFSKTYHIHKAIVAGRIRKEKGKFTIYSDIVNAIDVRLILRNKI